MSSASARSSNAPVHAGHKHLHNSKRDQLDKLIAAHAVALGITLVTNNVKEFAAYPGLQIENWLDERA